MSGDEDEDFDFDAVSILKNYQFVFISSFNFKKCTLDILITAQECAIET